MSSIIWPLQYFNGILTKITFFIAMVIVSIMVLALSASALTRYISGHGFDWFIELPPALVSWLVFPLLGPLLKTGSHIEVDFVSTVMTKRTLRFVKLFVYFSQNNKVTVVYDSKKLSNLKYVDLIFVVSFIIYFF